MKWIYGIKNKMAVALLLFIILIVALLNNLNERSSSTKINQAIGEIYKDRLIPESYLLQYADYLHRVIEIADNETYTAEQMKQGIDGVMQEMQQLHHHYLNTKLTVDEAQHFAGFTKLCGHISTYAKLGDFALSRHFASEAASELKALSAIQLIEAKSLWVNADRLFVSGKMFSQFEVAVLIIIALIIQALILASKTLHENLKQQQPHLN